MKQNALTHRRLVETSFENDEMREEEEEEEEEVRSRWRRRRT
jgi:hypothetical protein